MNGPKGGKARKQIDKNSNEVKQGMFRGKKGSTSEMASLMQNF